MLGDNCEAIPRFSITIGYSTYHSMVFERMFGVQQNRLQIMGQIKRCFRDPPPERHSCGCSDNNRGSRGQSFGYETGKVAAEMIGALASL